MASGKTIRVNLAFGADTKAAKQQIQQLQQSLSQLASQPIGAGMGKAYTQELHNAKNAAIELKIALNNAVNVNTGKLNFNKFSQELKQNKMTLTDYAAQLAKLGPQGAESFMQLTRAIASSQTPLLQLEGQMAKLGQTMANTIRWQITSSITTGLMSAFSSVIQYSEELNESLTNIRIVTGKSAEQMSIFAKEANKAAKELSTTTTEYTNASLIYYQQGLSDSEVKQRTDITVKLANVVGENAETVSEWMTAIWNNFDNGSASMEHYADVLAKLGAATASSADEIAGGLEKFAAVAETVGLSYEYAAAALATITAETRQSEDVVGTALKTIFARIENLKLGETLEDGVDLGQYSLALQKVGVDILDANGNLKDMNTILDNIGLTWQTLEQQEKVALAQSVAGIRQYNQFMALMENWDVMERNVELAEEANGALEDQYQIYATGIEGAQKRVQTQLEEIKNTLLDEDDLIPLLNIADGALAVVSDLLDAIGGLPGILAVVSAFMFKAFGPQIANGINSLIVGAKGLFGTLTGATQIEKANMVQEAKNAVQSKFANTGGTTSISNDAQISVMQQEIDLQAKLDEKSSTISAANKEKLQIQQQIVEGIQKEYVDQAKITEELTKQADLARNTLYATPGVKSTDVDALQTQYEREASFSNNTVAFKDTGNINVGSEMNSLHGMFEVKDLGQLEGYENLKNAANNLSDAQIQLGKVTSEIQTIEKQGGKVSQDLIKKRDGLVKNVKNLGGAYQKEKKAIIDNNGQHLKSTKTLEKMIKGNEKNADSIRESAKTMKEGALSVQELENKSKQANGAVEQLGNDIDNAANKGLSAGERFAQIGQAVTSIAMGVSMVTSAFTSLYDMFAEGEVSFSGILGVITSLSMGLMALAPVMELINKKMMKNTGLTLANWLAKKLEGTAMIQNIAKRKAENKSLDENTAHQQTNAVSAVAAQIAKNWVLGLAIAAVVLALIGVAAAGAISASKGPTDEETVEQNTENIDALKDLDEQTKSVRELTKAYKELEASEQDTLEAQKDIAEALPGLIEKYKELESKLGIDFGSKQLQELLNQYEATGKLNVNKVEEITAAAEEKSAQTRYDAAQANAAIQARQALETQKGSNDGNVKKGKYEVRIGGAGAEEAKSSKILEDVMGDDWTGTKLTVKTGSASELVESYQKMIEARNRMAKELTQEELNASDTYRELNREIGELQESAEAAQASLNEMFVSAQTLFTEDKAETLKKEKEIDDYSSYADKRTALLDQLKKDYPGLTEE